MSNSVVLITGANTGLGLEIARALLRSSAVYTILLGSRSKTKSEVAIRQLHEEFPGDENVISSVQVDIENDESIQKAFEQVHLKFGRVDVLINNAGGQFDQQIYSGAMTIREVWSKSWDVNTIGTHILTDTFIPLLLRSPNPRLLFITSGTSTLAETDNLELPVNRSPERGWPKPNPSISAYRASKTGMNMMMREWARILQQDGVKTFCVSPGFLATGLGGDQERNRQMGAIDPAIGAELIRTVVEGYRDHDEGKVIRRGGVQPW